MDIHWKQEYTGDMEVRKRDGVTYLSYPRLERESAIVHGFSTRLGGVSEGCLGSMNLSFSRGDNPENVLENYRRISRAIGFPVESIVTSDQTHTTNVRQVGKEDCGCGVLTPRTFHDIDGLITNEPGVTLATFYADCVPLYFYDPTHKAIGLSHAESLSHRPGRPHRSHRSLHLPGLLRSKRRRHRRIPPGLSGNPPQKALLPETQRKVPVKPLGSLPPELPHQRYT